MNTPNNNIVTAQRALEKAHCLYLDPPWPGMGQLPYDTLPISRLRQFPVDELAAESAQLFCWVPQSLVATAVRLIEDHWGGWKVRGVVTWAKLRPGRPTHWLQANTELLLYATRGKGPESRARQRGQGTLLVAPVTINSAKPPEGVSIAERVGHPPFVECFARIRPNSTEPWQIWGGECDSDFSLLEHGWPVSSDFARQGTDPRVEVCS